MDALYIYVVLYSRCTVGCLLNLFRDTNASKYSYYDAIALIPVLLLILLITRMILVQRLKKKTCLKNLVVSLAYYDSNTTVLYYTVLLYSLPNLLPWFSSFFFL